ncbi:DUF429 domain-containing protein [Clostridium butyricum]|uniref:DUF429 domain-containing protein n=1 Tax=Clostridium butyricum E4 str. BoNT E BL5262 TaxID=632245 RepID=C4IIJ3_CLOBU|nr:conserved hypothetical protein [Clostridium butyricum 5521]EEP54021.1 conserved hypothetical protein [Clostridium butyricum E4 str. BoNT E BL5262]NFL31034.1 DUF429 domain-containing protein [Clostridium butyricum]NFS19817.1 DUF429 domain-containing protein [Clostridium butyricum]
MKDNLNKYSCVGIDVCKGKWIAVCISENGFDVGKFNTIDEICRKYENADRIIVDMPIGLLDDNSRQRPESEARKYLKGKTSSIFNTPCRSAVYSDDYESACRLNKEVLGVGLAIQSYAICSKIREVDEFLRDNPKWKNRLLEAHPEICFAKLNGDKAVIENKTKEDGQKKRLEILKKYYSDSKRVVEKFLQEVPSRKKIDDVIDALCLSVTGFLGMKYGLNSIPKNPEVDINGIKMQMVYCRIDKNNCSSNKNLSIYNKLVRDNIPEIIKAENKKCEIEIVTDKEKFEMLKKKLQEEVNEFFEDKNIDGIADIMEVLFEFAEYLGVDEKQVMKERNEKKNKYGVFKDGVVLKNVEDSIQEK